MRKYILFYREQCFWCGYTNYFSYISYNEILCYCCNNYTHKKYINQIGIWDWA